jgi:hypothetical protein
VKTGFEANVAESRGCAISLLFGKTNRNRSNGPKNLNRHMFFILLDLMEQRYHFLSLLSGKNHVFKCDIKKRAWLFEFISLVIFNTFTPNP